MDAIKIKDDIYWVGAVDWNLRNFHGYLTQRGSSYNSYLILDEKIVLIDNVKHYLFDEFKERIEKIVPISKIDYYISNHVEMDHSGSLPKILELNPNLKIYTSPNGLKGLKAHYKKEFNYIEVKSGDKLNIGKRNLVFLLTPMVHWPDNMVTYCQEEKILFSNDGFGQHIASFERFDEEYDRDILFYEAKKYYANIVLPYGDQVQKELSEAQKLEIEIICPSHGLIIKKFIKEFISNYDKWSKNLTERKAVIVYDTMWNSTKMIADAIKSVLDDKKISFKYMPLQENHISDVITEILDSEYIFIGSPTLNKNMLPTVSAFITYFKGLNPKNRKIFVFGSYGWGGESIKDIEKIINEMGLNIIGSYKIQYVPSDEDLNKIKDDISNKL
ncbi:MAG: FprA family A-type flavoprotein [Spirochaetes bacterium]|nr:FprA family A-type flavoprotein [Spirochaetota bacterium]